MRYSKADIVYVYTHSLGKSSYPFEDEEAVSQPNDIAQSQQQEESTMQKA